MENSFNIFRINCLIGDKDSNNLKGIIDSILCEYLYENGNTEVSSKDCFKYITEIFNVKIDLDFLRGVIDNGRSFDISNVDDDFLIKLTGDRIEKIRAKLKTDSIEVWLTEYCESNSLDKPIEGRIKDILYSTIYTNINTFVSSDLRTLLSEKVVNKHNQIDIDHFNSFLDWDNENKNEALYKCFVKAIEFGILTSGRGIKEFSEKIFDNKTYLLDTNILFRLLGIGGIERQASIEQLMDNCHSAGIGFKISFVSETEFNRKLDERVNYLNKVSSMQDFDILSELIESGSSGINFGFETCYVQLRKKGIVKSPNDFQFHIKTELRKLKTKYDIENLSIKDKLDPKQLKKISDHFFKQKRSEYNVYTYSKKAAEVDAVNVIQVNNIRGENSYNYSDIKSFYLTTDRTLNKVLAENQTRIPESILPSQLYLLHKGENDINSSEDYRDFTKFLKRRTTQFKLAGNAVLQYIDEIRTITSKSEEVVDVIKSYSDYKYENPEVSFKYEEDIAGFRKFAETKLDKKIEELQVNSDKSIYEFDRAVTDLAKIFKSSKMIAIGIELAIVFGLFYLLINYSTNAYAQWIPIGISVIDRIVSYFLNDRFGFYVSLRNLIFHKRIELSNYYKYSGSKEEYLEIAKQITKGNNG